MFVALENLLKRILPERVAFLLISKITAIIEILLNKDGTKTAERMSLIAFAIRIFSAAIAFISQIILARMMGEFEYGIFVFVWVFAILAGNLSCLGLHTAVIKFLPIYKENDANATIRGLTSTARIFALIASSLIAICGVVFVLVFQNTIPQYFLVPIIIGAFALPMVALGDVLDGTARANGWPVFAMSPTFIIRPTLIIVFIIFAILLGYQPSAKIALICALIATFTTTLGQFLVIDKKIDIKFESKDRKYDLKSWFAVTLPIFVIEGFYYLLTNADVLIVGLYLKPEQVAVYFAAAKTMALVHFVFFAVKAGTAPRFSQLHAQNDTAGLHQFAKQAARWTFWPTLIIGTTVLLSGHILLSMFGEAFTSGHILMAILFSGVFIKSLIGPGEVLLTMVGKQRICAIIYATALAVNIALNMILIPQFGLVGAAMATSGAMIIETLLLYTIIYKSIGVTMFAFSKMTNQNDRNASARDNTIAQKKALPQQAAMQNE